MALTDLEAEKCLATGLAGSDFFYRMLSTYGLRGSITTPKSGSKTPEVLVDIPFCSALPEGVGTLTKPTGGSFVPSDSPNKRFIQQSGIECPALRSPRRGLQAGFRPASQQNRSAASSIDRELAGMRKQLKDMRRLLQRPFLPKKSPQDQETIRRTDRRSSQVSYGMELMMILKPEGKESVLLFAVILMIDPRCVSHKFS